jgi:hypothetical protein
MESIQELVLPARTAGAPSKKYAALGASPAVHLKQIGPNLWASALTIIQSRSSHYPFCTGEMATDSGIFLSRYVFRFLRKQTTPKESVAWNVPFRLKRNYI